MASTAIDYIVNSIFSSRTYIISSISDKRIWLVDIGDTDKVFSIIPDDSVIVGVLFTHIHYDHIYGINKLLKRFPHCLFYTNAEGLKAFCSPRTNMSKYHNDPIEYRGANIRVLQNRDVVRLFDDFTLDVYETPGHNPSCLTFVGESAIFTGDSYIPGIKVVTTLPGGNKQKALSSLEQILSLSLGKTIYPGHD